MGVDHIHPLAIFAGEAALISCVTLALFRRRDTLGLAPVLAMVGMLQPLQVVLASTVRQEILPGIVASPGSAVLFTWTLVVVLLVYILEGASAARKAITGIVAANATAAGLFLFIAAQSADMTETQSADAGLISFLGSTSFLTHARVMVAGTVMLALDVVLVLIAYEAMGRVVRRPVVVRQAVALLAVLLFDTVGFGLGAFYGTRELAPFVLASFSGKAIFALGFSAVVAAYFRFFESQELASENEPLRDVFHVVTFREKYERERARSAASEARRAAILDAAQDAIIAVDAKGKVVECNLSAERVFGRDREAIIGQPFASTLVTQSESLGISSHGKRPSSKSSRPIAVKGLHEDGTEFDAEALVARSSDEEAGPLFVIAIRDVTERKRPWDKLAETQRLDTVGSLVGGIAHDFNNLLTVIVGNAEELQETFADEPEARGALEAIQFAGTRGAGLTKRLLTYSRTKPMELVTANMVEVLSDLEPFLRRTVREDVEFVLDLPREPQTVETCVEYFEQVMINLVVNALDAIDGSGRITVRVRPSTESDGTLRVTVTDDGRGMSDEVLQHVFEPFYSTKTSADHSGLGLWMCQSIVNRCGGVLSVESEVGRGSTFLIELPLVAAPAPALDELPPATPSGSVAGRRALVVEDDALVRGLFVTRLESMGLKVSSAADGLAALELMEREGAPDLLLTDVVMPRMSGPELVREALARWPEMHALCMSGHDEDSGALDRDAPRIGQIEKPCSSYALRERVIELFASTEEFEHDERA